MEATIKQAANNERDLRIESLGRGHYKISCTYRNNTISCTTTNTTAIDDFNSDPSEVGSFWNKRENRRLAGYRELCNEIIRANQD